MLRIFVDTCVWRHWFTFNTNPIRLNTSQLNHCENFTAIYKLVASTEKAEFLFNALIQHELGEKFKSEFNEHILPIARKIPIPLSRCDGLYRYDGSILHGGRMGGSLNDFLTADGYPQEMKISEATSNLKDCDKLYETVPRKRELDVEHMESALEAGANLFLTNDERTIINRLEKLCSNYDSSHPINIIHSITKTPTNALRHIQSTLSLD